MTMESVVADRQRNSNIHSDYSVQLNRWFLKPIGAWPGSASNSKLERFVSRVLIVICCSFLLFTIVPALLHFILEAESLRTKMKTMGPLSHWCVGGVNYTALLLHQNEIRRCMKHMETDWRVITREKDQRVMLRNAKLGRYVAVSCATFMQTGVLCFCMASALTTQVIRVGNETRTVHVLPCVVYKRLIDTDNSPANEIVLLTQFLSAFIVNSGAVGIFSLAAVLAAHACGQLSVLVEWITELVNESGNREKMIPLKEIGLVVEHHLRALTLVSGIEEIMSHICLLELVRCTFSICMLGYYIITEWDEHDVQKVTAYFILLASISFNIFVICYIGEVLTEKCEKVGEVVYMTNWYRLPDKRIRDLILIIGRSHVLVKVTAGKLVHMSIYTFGGVIKTAFTYLNLLCQLA